MSILVVSKTVKSIFSHNLTDSMRKRNWRGEGIGQSASRTSIPKFPSVQLYPLEKEKDHVAYKEKYLSFSQRT